MPKPAPKNIMRAIITPIPRGVIINYLLSPVSVFSLNFEILTYLFPIGITVLILKDTLDK
jgi:hypothetical protein